MAGIEPTGSPVPAGGDMKIVLNGSERQIENGSTVAELIEQLDLGGRRLAVEIGQEIVPKGSFAERVIEEGEQIEIVHAIGGG
jgi:sulfur carrier protein